MGPTLEDGQLIYGPVSQVTDLPLGWTAIQEAGTYRLEKRPDQAFFGFAVGQQSWKQFLFPPHQTLWQAERQGERFPGPAPGRRRSPNTPSSGPEPVNWRPWRSRTGSFSRAPMSTPPIGPAAEQAFIVAVNCAHQDKGTCFCVSMGTGPRVTTGFDLALTEVLQGDEHFFVVEPGTRRGADIIQAVPQRPATQAEVDAAAQAVAAIAANMGRNLDTAGLKDLLYANYEHPRWDDVAARCLTCGNCTMVCPTCFCHTLEDTLDLGGEGLSAGGSRTSVYRGFLLSARRQHPHLAEVPLPPMVDAQAGHLD